MKRAKKAAAETVVTVRSAKVGGPEGIKPGVKYRLSEDGEFEEVKS